MKKTLSTFMVGMIGSLLLFVHAFAACIGTSPNLTAASASRNDVADCVTVATYGDTINIPACALGNCVWSSSITITKDIKMVGAGVDLTYITNGYANDSRYVTFFLFQPDSTARERLSTLSGAGTFEITGVTFYSSQWMFGKSPSWISNYNLPAIRRVKIHDNKYVNYHRANNAKGYVHGVFYKNTLIDTSLDYPQGASWNSFKYDRMTLGSGMGWYAEDNTLIGNGTVEASLGGAVNDGGGYVVRYNSFTGTLPSTNTFIESHGNQPSYVFGPQITEVYGNNLTATGPYRFTDARGGKNIYLNNVSSAPLSYSVWEEFSDLATDPIEPVGRCPENQGVARQTCKDSCICQKVHDSYFINNRVSVNGNVHTATIQFDYECRFIDNGTPPSSAGYCKAITANSPKELVENIEFFNYIPSGFNGTIGAGCGTLTNRPVTCAPGVGYWVPNTTDDPSAVSCTNLTGFVGANATYKGAGTLYKCTSTNTWEAWYTPYPYPHPLRTGSSASTTTTPVIATAPATTTTSDLTTSETGLVVKRTPFGRLKKISR